MFSDLVSIDSIYLGECELFDILNSICTWVRADRRRSLGLAGTRNIMSEKQGGSLTQAPHADTLTDANTEETIDGKNNDITVPVADNKEEGEDINAALEHVGFR